MRKKIRPIFLVFLSVLLLLLNATKVFAGPTEYRQCISSENCEIGEFLYDDDYTPISNATCTLNSKDPQGNSFLNDVAMTSQTDGWYSYDVTTSGEDTGLYRSQICCTFNTEYICLDKSFEIASSSATLLNSQIADAVWDATRSAHTNADSFGANLQNPTITATEIWDHPQRSLTSFGTLVSDIWTYSSRSLNSFSSIVSSIWSNSDRTITSTTAGDSELATKTQVENLGSKIETNQKETIAKITTNPQETVYKIATNSQETIDIEDSLSELSQQLKNNRYFLELLVNAPIIETFIEEKNETPDLQAKIKETKKVAQALSTDINNLDQSILALNTNWDDTNYQIALNHVSSASRVLGVSTESELQPDNVNTKITWLNSKWKSPILSNLSVQTTSALSNIDGINREIRSYGKTFISQQYLNIAGEHIEKLEDIVGKETDSSKLDTLFGYIAYLEETSDTLVDISLDLDEIIEKWDDYTNSEKDIKLLRIKERFIAVNQIDGVEILLKKRINDDQHRENLALSLKGLINSNLIYLAQNADTVSQNTWLEHGSIIFRSLVSNPSDVVAQNVQIKYYLPQEVGLEHIIKIEDGLETKFDAEKNILYVSGQIMLAPGETKTYIVEVADVWIISDAEIESVRKQTDTLFNSLQNTSYFAQGSTIKADIDVNLDKIAILKEKNQTPELKIKSHREAMLQLNSAKTKLENLKTIVSSAGSIDTVFGFVGGVQVIAVWGLVIILISGFVFLMLYLKMIFREPKNTVPKDETQKVSKEIKTTSQSTKKQVDQSDQSIFALIKDIIIMKLDFNKRKKNILVILLVSILIAIIVGLVSVIISNNADDPELISPIPDSITGSFNDQFLEPTKVANSQVAQTEQPGFVLGETSEDSDIKSSEPIKEKLVRANIPKGYQAINVRTQPNQDSDLSGRLYINQNVYLLQKKDGWVFIKTANDSLEEPITGWILGNLISEIQQ
jgi:hypothetical protein